MDAIPVYEEFLGWFMLPNYKRHSQRALYACALTCRAWRVRAQYLLWTFPCLFDSQHFAHFNSAIRKSSNTPIIRGVALGSGDKYAENADLSTALGELFTHSFPHLRSLFCGKLCFERGPPLRVIRMRLPFFSSITSLAFLKCTFQNSRSMLDVVWACSNLATLAMQDVTVESEHCFPARFHSLSMAVENLRACRKLTTLCLDMDTIRVSPSVYCKF